MAQLNFEHIISLTEDTGNSEPILVDKLMIANEPNNELYQYYIKESLTRDKEADITLSVYTSLQWGAPSTHLTGFAVSNIGIKTFPQIGAYGFYTRLGESSSKLLLPIHLRRNVYYTAPTFTIVDQADSFLFTITNPTGITYSCFRVILQQGKFAKEYVTYTTSVEADKAELNGTYTAFCIGYVGEGQYISEESATQTISYVNPTPPILDEYYTKPEIDAMIGDIGVVLDEINGEVI